MAEGAKSKIGGLYAIIDPARVEPSALMGMTASILEGGASVVQLRDKISTARDYVASVRAMKAVCQRYGAPLIVNDRVDVALAAGADGVHVGPEDIGVQAVRAIVGPAFVVGASAGTVDAALQAEEEGADYLGVGAIYEARRSKPDASAPRGPEAIAAIVDRVTIPVVGIGGIGADNAAAVMERGASGVAVISALMEAEDPGAAARELSRQVEGLGA